MYLKLIAYFVVFVIISSAKCAPTASPPDERQTTIKTTEVQNIIEHKILPVPHNLFIGRCSPVARILHQENIILYNDGRSHLAAGIRMNVEDKVEISCVKIFDEVRDGSGGYPSFVAGGVGYNYIEFKVLTEYGKGFHFFVQIYGTPV